MLVAERLSALPTGPNPLLIPPLEPGARSGSRRRWPTWAIAASLAVHLALIVWLLFGPRGQQAEQAQREAPSLSMVFDNQPPTQSETQSQPQMNLLPPEMQQPAQTQVAPPEELPPPDMFSQNAEPVPQRPNRSSGKPNPFAHMKVYNFAPPQSQVVTHGTQPQRGLALNLAPVIRNGQLLDAVEHVSDPNASSDWLEGLNDWIAKHAYYPQSAGENGEEGDSTVEAKIDRSGRVISARLITSAGSRLLDVATLGIFRDQILPPFPDDMKDQDITVKLTVNYEIIRQ